MRRVGNSPHNKMFSVLISEKDNLVFDESYTVIFWAKVNKFNDENDCLEVTNANSWQYARSGDSSASNVRVLKLSDCKPGEWQKYAYEFTNISSFLSFRTPSYSDICIDDVKIVLKGYETSDDMKGAKILTAITDGPGNNLFGPGETDEYDENDGTLDETDENENNSVKKVIKKIKKIRKKKKNDDTNFLLIVIIASACVAAGGGVGTIILVARKRKKGIKVQKN